MCSWYEYAIEETWNGSTERVSNSVMPVRDSQCVTNKDRHVGLYNRYDPILAVDEYGEGSPNQHYNLMQNYPNPFNPQTNIRFALPKPGDVTLDIFDTQGRRVATLSHGYRAAGSHAAHWDGCNEQGVRVANGLYFYRMVTKDFSAVRKMTVLK